jgi:hypothetical protein
MSINLRRPADGRAYLVRGFNVSAFFEVLAEVVEARKVSWKVLAQEIGVSPATLMRRGCGRCPDGATLAALSAWAGLNPADFVVAAESGIKTNSLVAISGVLRSDPTLEPKAVQGLEGIIRAAYASFAQIKRDIALARAARHEAVAPLFGPNGESDDRSGFRDQPFRVVNRANVEDVRGVAILPG